MAISRSKNWISEVLNASDLNAEFNNILNNPVDLWSPAAKAASMNGFSMTWDAAGAVTLTSAGATSGLVLAGAALNMPQGADIASAATINLDTATGNLLDITGTTPISTVTLSQGRWRIGRFTGALTLTNGANLVLSGGANIVTEAGDYALFLGYASSVVRVIHFSGAADSPLDALNTCEGRITLTTATPVTIADVTAATTIYYTPYKGNRIRVYDGTGRWRTMSFSELSLAVPGTTNTMYDLFAYNNSGSVALESTAWTNDTTRATNLTLVNGTLVKSGVTTRRYLGSFRTTGVSGQTEDSLTTRYTWNYYNRALRPLRRLETTASWTYSTAGYQQANASASNQLNYLIGYTEDEIKSVVVANASSSGAALRTISVGIGSDSTTVNSAQFTPRIAVDSTQNKQLSAELVGLYPSPGRHYLAWLEYGGGADTQTWYGSGTSLVGTGIYAQIWG